jgi:ABC-2 type transport system ATP-binding protein
VILSTHYLQEVEASCSRVIIVRKGEIVANDTRDNLVSRLPGGPVLARIKGPHDAVKRQLQELLPGRSVSEVSKSGDYVTWRLEVGDKQDDKVSEAVAEIVGKNRWSLAELSREKATLETVFRKLTSEVANA